MKHLKTYEAFDKELVDELIDKGWDNLTNKEKDYLNNPDEVEMQIDKNTYEDYLNDDILAKLNIYDISISDGVSHFSKLTIEENEYECVIHSNFDDDYLDTRFDDKTPYDDYEGLEYEIDSFLENAFYEINKEE